MSILETRVKQGALRGDYCDDNRATVFKGIPYAKPPVGILRWRAPQAPASWEGVREAVRFSKIPMQPVRSASFYHDYFYPADMQQSEDCLYLNVYTPAKSPDDRLPVAVWIYGGAYTTGYANKHEFSGETFAAQGIVFVSFNYRTGIFGFMGHDELSEEDPDGCSGNYGLLDQIAALRWVRDNITAFGGNPDNVTIFGQSAGAMSCMNLCCTPETDGLFQRAIMESCGGLNVEFYRDCPTLEVAKERGNRRIKAMGYSSVAEARKASPEEIMKRWIGTGINGLEFQPNADRIHLPYSSAESIFRGKNRWIDCILGSTAEEGYVFNMGKTYSPEAYRKEAEHFYHEDADSFLKAVGYNPDGTALPADNFGDNMLAGGTAWNELRIKRGQQTFYQYYFDRKIPGEDFGAFHSAEHAYIFKLLNRFPFRFTGADYELSCAMNQYWVNFIRTGDPNGEGLPKWTRYGEDGHKFMEFGDVPQMIDQMPDRPGARFSVQYMLKEAGKYEV